LARSNPRTPMLIAVATLCGFGFALYLTYIEAFVLGVWCILCLSSLAVITAISGCAGALAWRTTEK
jgi:uncharacterized membrane protein